MIVAILWLLFSQLCFAYQPGPGDMEMQVWKVNGQAGDSPTWHLTVDPQFNGNPGGDAVLKIINQCYNWVSKQTGAKGKNNNRAVVVAGMYNAGTKMIEVSTVPRGAQADAMVLLRDEVPAWNAAAAAYSGTPNYYCAEDGVLFASESRVDDGITDGKYADGSFMLAWGAVSGSQYGGPWNPCSVKRQTSTAGCRTTLNNLNIKWQSGDVPVEWSRSPSPIDGDEGTGDQNPQDDSAVIQDIQMGDFPQKRDAVANDPVNTLIDELSTFSIRGRSQAIARRSDASPAAGSGTDATWPTYTGSVKFTPTKAAATTLPSDFLTTAAPVTTQPPTSTIPCSFKGADPDEGVDQGGCVCTVSGSTTTWPMVSFTPSGTKSVWGTADYCAYTAAPSSPAKITTDVSSWTSNCQACTLTGGIADAPTCTSVAKCTPTQPVPTFAVWAANRKLDIGDAQGTDNGTSLAKDMFKQLSSFCSGTSCDTGKYAKMNDIESVVGEDEEPLKPQMYWENAVFSDMDTLQQMLSAGLSTWIAASGKMCKEVEYEAEEDATGSGCGKGPLPMKRSDNTTLIVMPRSVERIEKRCDEDCVHPLPECHYKAYICSAPDLITVVKSDGKGNPYANEINIGVNYGKQDSFDEFLCELIVDGLTTLAMALFPELLPAEGAEEVEFQALCGELSNYANPGN